MCVCVPGLTYPATPQSWRSAKSHQLSVSQSCTWVGGSEDHVLLNWTSMHQCGTNQTSAPPRPELQMSHIQQLIGQITLQEQLVNRMCESTAVTRKITFALGLGFHIVTHCLSYWVIFTHTDFVSSWAYVTCQRHFSGAFIIFFTSIY